MRLDPYITISHCELRAKTQEADLHGDLITGKFSKQPLLIVKPARVCEEFANLSESESKILQFTEKYAPLMNAATPEGRFQFKIGEWRTWHHTFRASWEILARTLVPMDWREVDQSLEQYWRLPEGSRLLRSQNGYILQQERFLDSMNFYFFGVPLKYIRFCPAPGCKRPFFIADHLNQKYCKLKSCTDWGERKRKLEYWNRHKDDYLAERKRERSRSK